MGLCFPRPETGDNFEKTHRNGGPPSDLGFFDGPRPDKWRDIPGGITAEERLSLRRCQEDITRTIDIVKVIGIMFHKDVITAEDEDKVLDDPRRRKRIEIFLEILEKKPAETYNVFLEALEEHYPHLYLRLTDWEEDDLGYQGGAFGVDMLNTDTDEWTNVRHYRAYIIKEMDCDRILSLMASKEVFGEMEIRQIMKVQKKEQKNETFLDILETKESLALEAFLDAMSEVHPNIYLMLTEQIGDDDDGLGDL